MATLSTAGNTVTSPDGITWTAHLGAMTMGGNSTQRLSFAGGLFISTANGTTNQIKTSVDGVTWTPHTAAAPSILYRAAVYGHGRWLISSSSTLLTSTDGATWTMQAGSPSGTTDIVFVDGVFIAVTNAGDAFRSTDGVTWSAAIPLTPPAVNVVSMAYGDGVLVTVGQLQTDRLRISRDLGLTWQSMPAVPDGNGWQAITFGDETFVAMSNTGTGTRVMTSRIMIGTGNVWHPFKA
jgi:hypothetical protein